MTTSMMTLTWYKFDDVVYNFTLVDNFPTGTPSDQQPGMGIDCFFFDFFVHEKIIFFNNPLTPMYLDLYP